MRIVIALLLAFSVSDAAAQPKFGPDQKIDAATRSKVIEGTLAALTKSYVFPDVAAKVATEIKKHVAAKKYDTITSARTFADALTNDLRAVSNDKHIYVMFSPEPLADRKPDAPPPAAEVERFREQVRFWNAGFIKVERLAGNVGYLRLDEFAPPDLAASKAAAAMTMLSGTDALIIDLRNNGGGHPATVAVLVSYLYAADEEIHINDLYFRPNNQTRQFWTLPDLTGPRYPKKPVYVLTSKRTFSGAEEFAYDLQQLKRGTIVGEVTGGGANPGDVQRVHANFGVFVPTGRAINPVSKTNWEGVGVKPDVTATEDKALDVAYLAALAKLKPTIDPKKRPGMAREIDDAISRLKK